MNVSQIAKSIPAGALATLLLASGAAADVVTSTWTGNGDGTHWTDGANWSTNPLFPNDGGGHGYLARIDRDPGTPYTVLLDTGVFIDGLTLNSPRATLQQTAGTLNMNLGGTIDLQAGTYQLGSATIAAGRIQSEGGTFTISDKTGTPSTFDGVTLAAPIQVTRGNTLLLKNTLTLDGGSVTLVDSSSVPGSIGVWGSGDVTIGGTGSLVFGGSGGNGIIGCAPGRTLTIGPNAAVNTGTTGGTLGAGRYIDGTNPGTGTLINQGTINATTASIVLAGAWVNQGTMNVSGNGLLQLAGSGSNPGTIDLSGGQLIYTGAFSTANIVNLVRTGGTLWFKGTVDNAGRTLDLNRLGPIWLQGSLGGGTLRSDGPAELMVTGSSSLSDITLAGNVRFSAAGNTPALSNITMAGHDLIVEATNGQIDLSKISGNGRIVIAGVPSSSGYTARITGPLGPSFSIVTATNDPTARGTGIYNGANSGTILAQTPGIAIQLDGPWSNPTGHVAAITGGVLIVNAYPGSFGDFSVTSAEVDLQVPLTTAQLRGIDASAATFGIFNTLTNTNDTFALTGHETVKLGGTIVGGAITGTATDRMSIRDSGGGTLQDLVLGVPLTLQHDAVLNASNLTLNGTSITLVGGQFGGTKVNGTVLGSGEIVFDGPSQFSQVTAAGGFVVNPGITVRTGAGGGMAVAPINKGTIRAQTPGQTLTVSGAWDNTQGTIAATNGSTLLLSGTTSTAKVGSLVNNGGTMVFAAQLDNTSQTFKFGGDKGTWLYSGQATGGTVDLTGATVVPVSGGTNPELNSVTLAADVHVGNQMNSAPSLTIRNAIDAAGHTISVANTGSAGATLQFLLNSPFTLNNANISLSNATLTMATQSSGTTLTLGQTAVVSGSGAMTSIVPPLNASVAYDNEGRIVANVKNQTLTVRPASLVNYGTMAATDGGVLSIAPANTDPAWTDNGILAAGAGSRISVAKTLAFADGSACDVSFDPTGAVGLLQVNGTLDLSHVESLNLDVPPGTPFGTYLIATYTSGRNGTFDQVTPNYPVDYSTPGQVRVTVPEPAGGCLVLFAGVGLLSRRRQGRRRARG